MKQWMIGLARAAATGACLLALASPRLPGPNEPPELSEQERRQVAKACDLLWSLYYDARLSPAARQEVLDIFAAKEAEHRQRASRPLDGEPSAREPSDREPSDREPRDHGPRDKDPRATHPDPSAPKEPQAPHAKRPGWTPEERAVLEALRPDQRQRFLDLPRPEQRSLMDQWLEAGGPGARTAPDDAASQWPYPDPPTGEPAEVVVTTKISQRGITLTFAQPERVSKYRTGDRAVLLDADGVQIVSIDPPSRSGPIVENGAMANPMPALGSSQGFDSRAYQNFKTKTSYQNRLNVALDVSPGSPLDIRSPTSIVFSQSMPRTERPQLKAAMVVTFVDVLPPAGSMRPGYSSRSKAPLHPPIYSRVPSVVMPGGGPSLLECVERTRGPYVGEWVPNFIKRYLHPFDNMIDYGAYLSRDLGECWLRAMDGTLRIEKRKPLIDNLCQIGIDWLSVAETAKNDHWALGGGHAEGVLPILVLTSHVLGLPSIRDLRPKLIDNSIGQTYYVPTSYVGGHTGHTEEHVGMAEWGNKHAHSPNEDDVRWDVEPGNRTRRPNEDAKQGSVKSYRAGVCSPSRWALATALYVVQQEQGVDLLRHPPYLDYQRRFRFEVDRRKEQGQRRNYLSPWSLSCWDKVGPPSDEDYPTVP